jgi:hypothetical protein
MIHPGSIYIDKIDFNTLRFLTTDHTDSVTSSNFDLTTGKPSNNLHNNSNVNSFLLDSIVSNLFENNNINDSIIYDYPKLLETNVLRDIQITNETTIDVVFITEGASMKNMFGYYMYEIDNDGVKKLLSNGTDTDGYYYNPTVIFPHVYSIIGDHNTLQQGDSRRLKGNLPNGNFQNIFVGLFLVPHGWYAFQNNSTIDNNNILYSTIDFNKKYIESEFGIVNDKIYSIYFKASINDTRELLLSAFEDVFINGTYDLDYNDCVIGLEVSNVSNIVDYDKYTKIIVQNKSINNSIIFIDENGEFVYFNKDIYYLPEDRDYVFERHIFLDNFDDMNNLYNLYRSLMTNYKMNIYIDDSFGQFKVIIICLFRKNDINNNKGNEKSKKLYLLETKYNKSLAQLLNNYKIAVTKNMNNLNYSEKYRVYEKETENELIHLTDIIDGPIKISNNSFRIIGNGIMDCINGKAHLPFNQKQIYQVYKNISVDLSLTINIKMSDHPNAYMLGAKNFVRYVAFNINGDSVVIDLGSLDLYTEVNGSLLLNNDITFNKIKISSITVDPHGIKDLLNIFRSDSNAYYRTITLDDRMTFYCIRLPNVKNNPTSVYLASSFFLEWNDKYNTLGGTYYNKQKIYKINSFLE